MQAPEQGLPELRERLWHQDVIQVQVFWFVRTRVDRERGGEGPQETGRERERRVAEEASRGGEREGGRWEEGEERQWGGEGGPTTTNRVVTAEQ